ncbi:MAG TPA: type II secretion system F family protein [Kribbellaceae bacterium]
MAAIAASAAVWTISSGRPAILRLRGSRSGPGKLASAIAPDGSSTPGPSTDRSVSRTRLGPGGLARVARSHRLAAGAGAVGVLAAFGLPWGLPVAGVVLVAVPVLLRRIEPAGVRRRRERVEADLPLAVELLAACLRAGRPPGEAVALVASAVGGPLGAMLDEIAGRLVLGADPAYAWAVLAGEPACAPLSRAVVRSAASGGPLARTLEQLATDVWRLRQWAADERARTVETKAVVPLGLCFLPAFVLIGIAPTIAGSLTGLVGVFGG